MTRESDPSRAAAYVIVAALLLIASGLLIAVRASAAIVCSGHVANPPYVQTGGNPSTLAGSGGVYGCNPRFSKSYYLTVRFACKVGQSRMVTAGDGVVVEGQPVRFTNPDGEGCGNWGGGL